MRHLATLVSLAALTALTACSAAAPPIDAAEDETNAVTAPGASSSTSAPRGTTTAGADRIDLGDRPVGTVIAFDVPAGTIGFTVVVDRTAAANEAIGVDELVDPTGKTWSDSARGPAGPAGAGVGVMRVPFSNDHATDAIPAGRWTVKLGGSRVSGGSKTAKGTNTPIVGQLHGRVFLQTGGHLIDLDVYVPDGLVVDGNATDAASAETSLKTRIDLAYGLFQRLYGLDRGAVRFHAVDGAVRSIVGIDGVDDANTLATAAQSDHPSAQIVLTNSLSPDGDGSEISGISCLPGAVGVPGTKCSAVLVSLRASAPDWMDASTIAHELGHFAGLEHTTEFGGDFDRLADTPACTNTSKSALSSCPDHDNLMFPSVNLADDAASIGVSADQRAIFVSSALAHR